VLGIALAAALAFGVLRRQNIASQRITRLSLLPPEKSTFVPGTVAVAPDGSRIAFVALTSEGGRLLWVRALDALEAQPLAGTEGAVSPFWSPDSRFIGFFAEGKLKKVELSGGVPQTVCVAEPIAAGGGAAGNGRGGTWSRDGTIVFAPNPLAVLHRVSAAGGQPEPLTVLDAARQENSHRWPYFLPDSRHFLFFARSRQRENRAIYVGSLDSRVTRRLMPADSNAIFVPPGYLLFLREGTLVALPFNDRTLQSTGEPIRVAERVRGVDAQGPASFHASDTGVLAYGSGSTANQQLAWFNREGERLGTIGPGGSYLDFRLSPDQKRVALDVLDPEVGGRQIWLLDLGRDVASRITSEPWQQELPIWSPDGDRLVFASDGRGVFNLGERAASGVGNEATLLESSTADLPSDWSSDGRYILFERVDPGTGSASKANRGPTWVFQANRSLWVMPMFGERKPQLLLQSPYSQSDARFSPDGRRIAYVSNESGRPEVYVETFPAPTGKMRISTAGGSEPFWRPDGRELFYLAPDRRLMAVSVMAEPSRFEVGRPQPLFQIPPEQLSNMRHHYAVAADGQRFLLAPIAEEGSSPTVTVVLNWTAALRK
jgi:Tol biopolymer transport system component